VSAAEIVTVKTQASGQEPWFLATRADFARTSHNDHAYCMVPSSTVGRALTLGLPS